MDKIYKTMICRHWTSGSIGQWPKTWETKKTIPVVAPAYFRWEVIDQSLERQNPGKAWESPSWENRTRSLGRPGIHRQIPKRRELQRGAGEEVGREGKGRGKRGEREERREQGRKRGKEGGKKGERGGDNKLERSAEGSFSAFRWILIKRNYPSLGRKLPKE